MEKEGVRPDVLVENQPDQLARGVDGQLDKAVEVLQADVVAWKKSREPAVAVMAPPPVKPAGKGVAPTPAPVGPGLVTPAPVGPKAPEGPK